MSATEPQTRFFKNRQPELRLYREENIRRILSALDADQYDDVLQDEAVNQDDFLPPLARFLDLFVQQGKVLEIGCGSGASIGKFGINYGVEPCEKRYRAAARKAQHSDDVPECRIKRNVVECLEFPAAFFDTVLMINGWFQVRSDYEALIEVNRVLRLDGSFIFNLLTNDEQDIICGRCLGPKNYARLVEQFGFERQAWAAHNAGDRFVPDSQISTVLAFRKVREFDERWLSLPQVNREHITNYVPDRDWKLI